MRPSDAAVMPLPREEVTPPVTKTNFGTGGDLRGFSNVSPRRPPGASGGFALRCGGSPSALFLLLFFLGPFDRGLQQVDDVAPRLLGLGLRRLDEVGPLLDFGLHQAIDRLLVFVLELGGI